MKTREDADRHAICAAYKGGPKARQCNRFWPILHKEVTTPHKPVSGVREAPGLVYIAPMPGAPPTTDRPRSLIRRLAPLIAVVLLAIVAFIVFGRSGLSLEELVRHRTAIGAFVTAHRLLAVLAYIALYIAAIALSVPGAVFLTVAGGFLFGLAVGAAAAVIGATIGATIIFLIARSALGEPLLQRAGPRAARLAQGFRDDAFSYLLFLRLVPAFPFFLVNLVPALAGVRLLPFVAATFLGVIPGALVYAFAGTGLDSVIAAQKDAYDACMTAGKGGCRMTFNVMDVLTPQLIGALIALGLLALVPVLVKRLHARSRAPM
jgi:uncharacterized membrane protein YdjX (TVP38/TMEM64 family)